MGVEKVTAIDSLIGNTSLYISEDAKKALQSGVDYIVPHTWQEIKTIIGMYYVPHTRRRDERCTIFDSLTLYYYHDVPILRRRLKTVFK